MPYEKPYLTIDEQLDQLQTRGLDLGDRAEAAAWLRRVGYYRLSGYWYPFRHSRTRRGGVRVILDTFVEGTTLAQVIEIYEFDRRLRLLVMDGIERVEVSLRFHVGHTLGRRGAFAHADPNVLDGDFAASGSTPAPALGPWMISDHARWLKKRLDEERRSKADFVKHFKDKYGLPLPVWVVTEILDFGGLSLLYGGMLQRDRDEVAAALGLFDASAAGNGGALKDWLRNLNYVRNICAHHARLWNANIVDRIGPRGLRPVPELAHIADAPPNATSRPYASLAVLALLTARIHPEDDWTDRLAGLMADLPAGRAESELGFPDGWRDLTLWRQKPLV